MESIPLIELSCLVENIYVKGPYVGKIIIFKPKM